jgi:hypothetical protein
MSARLRWSTALLVLLAGALLYFFTLGPDGRSGAEAGLMPVAPTGPGVPVESPKLVPAGSSSNADPVARRSVPQGETAARSEDNAVEPEVPSHGSGHRVRGRVLRPSALPVSGVTVRLPRANDQTVRSGSSGNFEFVLQPGITTGEIDVDERGWATLFTSLVSLDSLDHEHVVVVLPAINLAGSVVDTSGVALEGARLSLRVGDGFQREFPYTLDRNRPRAYRARSDELGHFELHQVPEPSDLVHVDLVTNKTGFRESILPIPPHSYESLLIELEARQVEDPEVSGVVLLPDRRPAANAEVQLGSRIAKTDSSGVFHLSFRGFVDEWALAAGLEGYGTVVLPDFGRTIRESQPDLPAQVTLILGEAALAISGRAVDSDGLPLTGWDVSIVDATAMTTNRVPPMVAETLGGGSIRMTTRDDGSFEFGGLIDRTYTLRIFASDSLLTKLFDAVPAGTEGLLLRVGGDLYHERIRGLVQARDGTVIAGARVILGLVTSRIQRGSSTRSGQEAMTDAGGAFEMERIPKAHVHLDVTGQAIIPQRFEFEAGVDVENLRLSVARRCHFRVKVKSAAFERTQLELLDDAGQNLSLYTFRGGGWSSSTRVSLDADGTPTMSVSEDARELRLHRGREVILSQGILLDVDQINELEVEIP